MFRATTWTLIAAAAVCANHAGQVSGQTSNQVGGQTRGQTTSPAANYRSGSVQATIAHCQVFLIKDTEVPAREAGPILELNVREGDQVQPGTLLAKIDDRQAQFDKLSAELKRAAAETKSQDDIEVRYSEAALGVADAELAQSEDINRHSKGTISSAEIRRLKLTRQKAALQIDRSRLELKIAGMTADAETTAVAAAEDRIRRRQITSPCSGIVLEVLRDAAEWVNAGEPVIRIIRLDRLRVEGFLNGRDLNPEDVARRPVTVAIQRAHGQVLQLPGTVVFVSPLVQAGDKYRVRAEVENRMQNGHWALRPGMAATMAIHVDASSGGVAPAPARPPVARNTVGSNTVGSNTVAGNTAKQPQFTSGRPAAAARPANATRIVR